MYDFEVMNSCENPHIQYLVFPDGHRLIFFDGEYMGWYNS